MPTDEYKPLLDRQEATKNAEPLVQAACPLLREVVNHASWVFPRCDAASDAHGAENEDLAAFVLYRHLIELLCGPLMTDGESRTDGIEVMFRSSCVDAAVPAIRAAFEASLSLDYILRDDYTRRSLAWTCAYVHSRILTHERLDAKTKTGVILTCLRERISGEWLPPSLGRNHGRHHNEDDAHGISARAAGDRLAGSEM